MSFEDRGSGAGEAGGSHDPAGEADWTSGDLSHFVIPDDIRELDNDVRAYRRERRTARRRQHVSFIFGGHRGFMVPMMLILTLIIGSYSAVVLIAGQAPPIGHGGERLASPQIAPGQRGGLLPALNVADTSGAAQNLRTFRPAALLLLPGSCTCDSLVRRATAVATQTGTSLYLVSTAIPNVGVGVGPDRTHWRVEGTGQLLPAYGVAKKPVLLAVKANGIVEQIYRTMPPDSALRLELGRLI
ncbi:MAG: hypothetical protein ACR2F6_06015 [Mycobacteriales bacterium]